MPAVFPGNAIVRLSFYWSVQGQVAQIDRNISAMISSFDSGWTSTDLFATVEYADIAASCLTVCANSVKFLGSKLYWKPASSGSPPQIATSPTGGTDCTGGTGLLPTQVTGLVRWTSNIGGKRGQGRDYFPFPWDSANDANGKPTVAYQSAIAGMATALLGGFIVPSISGITSLEVKPCTLQTTGGTTPLAYPMTGVLAAGGFATQRRRGYFGKLNPDPFG